MNEYVVKSIHDRRVNFGKIRAGNGILTSHPPPLLYPGGIKRCTRISSNGVTSCSRPYMNARISHNPLAYSDDGQL